MPISPPDARASLILRLCNMAHVSAWDEFAEIYSPAVYRSARRIGLQAAGADDCVQEVLSAVADSVVKWLERSDRGAFRVWLFRVARNMAIDFLTGRKHRPWAEGGDTAANKLVEISAQPDVSSQFDIEYPRAIFLRASEIVRDQVIESTWEAFHRTSVLQRGVDPPSEVLVQRNNISQASRVYATLP